MVGSFNRNMIICNYSCETHNFGCDMWKLIVLHNNKHTLKFTILLQLQLCKLISKVKKTKKNIQIIYRANNSIKLIIRYFCHTKM